MSTITLRDIGLKPSVLRAAEKRAKREGLTTPEYLRTLIERDLLAARSFDEILRPPRRAFERSGGTETGLDRAIEEARSAYAARSRRKPRT